MRYLDVLILPVCIILILVLGYFYKSPVNRYSYVYITNTYSGIDAPGAQPSSGSCEIYKLPDFRDAPSPPIEDLKNLNEDEQDKIDDILLKYTQDLSSYIKENQKQLTESYNDYLKSCTKK